MAQMNVKGAVRIISVEPGEQSDVVDAFMMRPPTEKKAEEAARTVLQAIRERGDEAVLEYIEKFDGARLEADQLKVTRAEMRTARTEVTPEFEMAAKEACRRIVTFARESLRKDWQISTPKGGHVGERYVPYERIGAYIPGGAAPLASTALMTVTLAATAGVKEVVACTPADAFGRVDPSLLFALELAGATEIYKVGGIQSIGAMAYGTKTIAKVQKIVGPGGPYVTAAKRAVYGDVALDMVAGPSEIAVLADHSAVPAYVAADLLSQAEHGSGSEKVLLVTSSMRLAEKVRDEMLLQAETLSRTPSIKKVFERGTLLVVVANLQEGMDLCNRFAPEHLELLVPDPNRWLRQVTGAGAVFVGPWTPECAGDFVAGPSHVLPTGGTATMFSGLTVNDFVRKMSVVSFTRADLQDTLPVIEAFGAVEGLDAHSRSASIRFKRSK